MLKRHTSSSADFIAIDLGGFHSRVYSTSHGMLVDQPSIGMEDIDHSRGGIDAIGPFGNQAQELLSNADSHLRSVQPIQSDNHNELGFSQKMLRYFIAEAKNSGELKKLPGIDLLVPHNCKQAIADKFLKTCKAAGASNTRLADSSLSAFYGMQIDHPRPCILIDFGATNSRLIAVADGVVQHHHMLQFGGDLLDRSIYYGLLKKFGLHISQTQARKLKHKLGAATPRSLVKCTHASMQLEGLAVNRNVRSLITIDSESVNEIFQPVMAALSKSLSQAFSTIPPYMKDAAYDTGIQLCGGGALLSRMEQLVMEATDWPVEVASSPLTCAVRGANKQFKTTIAAEAA